MAEHSKLFLALMGKKPPLDDAEDPKEDAGDEEESDMSSEGLHASMQDFLDAVHKGDVDAMTEAFKDAMDNC